MKPSNGPPAPLFDAGLSDLDAAVRDGALLGFDYDGTLAPLVDDPRRAWMRATTRALFCTLVERFPCVVISGRARRDVASLLGACQPFAVVGNHGVETGEQASAPPAALLKEWRAELEERLETIPGITIEDKTYSLTIHYRAAPDPAHARLAALRATTALESARVVRGIRCLNLVPEAFPDKGAALLRLADQAGCRNALFIGDDRTDEDAFAAAPDRVLGIRVKHWDGTAARYYLRDQAEVDLLLARLLELPRPAPVAAAEERRM